MIKSHFPVSVIITTYNRPDALRLVLEFLLPQLTRDDEILIADDGSTMETRQLVENFANKTEVPLYEVWHEDQGFRAAAIRNKAALKAKHDYLILMDGDVIPPDTFIARHKNLAEFGYFVAGNRILLSETYTKQLLTFQQAFSNRSHLLFWLKQKYLGRCNRILPLVSHPFHWLRKLHPLRWKKCKTCNLGVWKNDFLRINGFDEAYQGWGYEDSDLIVRLQHAQVYCKSGNFSVPVFHLWHAENDRSNQTENFQRFLSVKNSVVCECTRGISQYMDRTKEAL